MDVELARQQWDEGRRRIDRLRTSDPAAYRRLTDQVQLISDELRKRVGQTFVLAELVAAYARADDWARDLLLEAAEEGEGGVPETTTVTDAAFHRYARGAFDYTP